MPRVRRDPLVTEVRMTFRLTRSLPAALAVSLLATAPSAGSAAELITNGNFNAGATGFSTTYDQTDPGGYIFVTTNPALLCSSCFPSMGDHTTGSGNMLFIDGAGVGDGLTPASHPYYSVTLGVAPNSDYAFSYWAANLGPSNQPSRFSHHTLMACCWVRPRRRAMGNGRCSTSCSTVGPHLQSRSLYRISRRRTRSTISPSTT